MEAAGATIGLVAGIASIVNSVGKSITSLYTLQRQWNDSDLTIKFLIGQLKAIKAALRQVHLWAQSISEANQDQEVLISLDESLCQCRVLIEYLNVQVLKICSNDGHVNAGGRLMLLLEDKTTNSYLSMLDRIVSALNLLLTAAHSCRSAEDQRRWLSTEPAQTLLEQVRKDDSSSLLAFYDATTPRTPARRASISTCQTRFSIAFDFDEILLKHKAYQQSLRSMLRRAVNPAANAPLSIQRTPAILSRSQSDTAVPHFKNDALASARIDAQIRIDARQKNKVITVLAFGSDDEKSTAVKLCGVEDGSSHTTDVIEDYRRRITSLVVQALCAIIVYVERPGACIQSEQERSQVTHVKSYASIAGPEWRMSSATTDAIRGIWQNWHVMQAFQNMNQDCTTAFLLRSITRICRIDYTPTPRDIVRAPEHIDTIKETHLAVKNSTATIIEINETKIKRYIGQFFDPRAILYVVDAASYDGYSTTHHNMMREQLSHFKHYCNSRWFKKSFILLCITNTTVLARKLAVSPLSNSFKDYSGGQDASAATKYIMKLFEKANYYKLPLYPFIGDLDLDRNSIRKFVKDCINLKATGLMLL